MSNAPYIAAAVAFGAFFLARRGSKSAPEVRPKRRISSPGSQPDPTANGAVIPLGKPLPFETIEGQPMLAFERKFTPNNHPGQNKNWNGILRIYLYQNRNGVWGYLASLHNVKTAEDKRPSLARDPATDQRVPKTTGKRGVRWRGNALDFPAAEKNAKSRPAMQLEGETGDSYLAREPGARALYHAIIGDKGTPNRFDSLDLGPTKASGKMGYLDREALRL